VKTPIKSAFVYRKGVQVMASHHRRNFFRATAVALALDAVMSPITGCQNSSTIATGSFPPVAATSKLASKAIDDREPGAIFSVHEYDPSRNPASDLASTIKIAQDENKRILLQVGGQWCGWCKLLSRYIGEHPSVQAALRDHYVVMRVNYGDGNDNESFLS
jgi:hypothetical protein